MPTQQKIDRVQDIKDRLERSTIAMTTSYSGISVNEMVLLRRAMRGGGVDFAIVKNTLLALAAEGAQKPQLKEIVQGPTAIAFGYDDPVDAAKVVADYIRTGGSALALLGAVMGDGTAMSAGEVTRLASLPPRDQLIAMLLGQMQSPIAGLLTVLSGPLQSLSNVMQARVRQMEEEGPTPEPEPAAVAEPEASVEPESSVEPEATGEAEEAPTAMAEADASADDKPVAESEEAPKPEAAAEPEATVEEEPKEAPATEAEPEPETETDVKPKPEESDGETATQ